MALSLGTLSNFFSQFQPYEQGGITGQPQVDPGQLQTPQIDYSRMDPNTAARLQTEAAGYGYGGRRPDETDEQYRSRVQIGMQPTIDPSRYDPSKTFEDYYRDYHSPDRDAVLRDYPGGPISEGQKYLDWINRPGPRPAFGSDEYLRQWHEQFGNGYSDPTKPQTFGGGMFGRLGSLSSTLPSQGQGGVLNALLHHLQTPDGRMVQVPDHQLAEALQRGGRKVTSGSALGALGGGLHSVGKAFGGLFGGLF